MFKGHVHLVRKYKFDSNPLSVMKRYYCLKSYIIMALENLNFNSSRYKCPICRKLISFSSAKQALSVGLNCVLPLPQLSLLPRYQSNGKSKAKVNFHDTCSCRCESSRDLRLLPHSYWGRGTGVFSTSN